MFDFGFAELFVIIAVGILVAGPKDIPGLLQNLGKGVRRLQYMKYAVSQQFEDFMKEHDLNEVRHLSVDPLADVDEKEADAVMEPLSPSSSDRHPRVVGGDPTEEK